MAQHTGTVEYEFGGKTYAGSYVIDENSIRVTSEIGSLTRARDGNDPFGWTRIMMAEIVGAAFRDRRLLDTHSGELGQPQRWA